MKKAYKCYIARESNVRGKRFPVVREKNSDIKLNVCFTDRKSMEDWMLFLNNAYKEFSVDSKFFSKTDMSEYLLIEGTVKNMNMKNIDDDSIFMFFDSSFNCTHQVESQFMPVQFTPKGKQTASQCLKAVKQNGLSLEYVSKRFHTFL